MTFSENYRYEVLQSRRTRRTRALFWAKVLSLLLMILVAVTMRSEPHLRQALTSAAMEAAMNVAGKVTQAQAEPSASVPDDMDRVPDPSQMMRYLPTLMDSMAEETKVLREETDRAPQGIKINRPGVAQDSGTGFKRVLAPTAERQTRPSRDGQIKDTQAAADALQNLMKDFKVGQ